MRFRRYPAEAAGARTSSREDCARGDTMSLSCARTRNAIRFLTTTTASPFPVFRAFAPPIPFLRNYVRNERLYERLSRHLVSMIRKRKIDLIHAQHVLTGPPSVMAARRAGIPSVCTVRDYWPVCYWGDVLADPGAGVVCPGCSASAMTRCLRPRTGAAWPADAAR